MKSSDMLNKIKTILDIQVDLEDRKLENGTVITAETFSNGKEVFIKTDDEKVKMPIGEYELESGEVLVVKEEGLIEELKEAKEEGLEEHEEKEDKEEMKYVTREEFRKEMDELKKHIEDMMDHKEGEKKEEEEKVDAEEKLSKDEEVKAEEVINEELSKPATEPIKHSPETGSAKRASGFQFSESRAKTVKDRILEKLNNL
tara:strand:+ start:597 stop:1199 length:603 start_codon:yes stop_codon:yes gene_type:complete